jgi:predicted enzyme related to lactoylglutathione lyase
MSESGLQDSKAFSGFSVDDPDAAKRFYGETLGLRTEELVTATRWCTPAPGTGRGPTPS